MTSACCEAKHGLLKQKRAVQIETGASRQCDPFLRVIQTQYQATKDQVPEVTFESEAALVPSSATGSGVQRSAELPWK